MKVNWKHLLLKVCTFGKWIDFLQVLKLNISGYLAKNAIFMYYTAAYL